MPLSSVTVPLKSEAADLSTSALLPIDVCRGLMNWKRSFSYSLKQVSTTDTVRFTHIN